MQRNFPMQDILHFCTNVAKLALACDAYLYLILMKSYSLKMAHFLLSLLKFLHQAGGPSKFFYEKSFNLFAVLFNFFIGLACRKSCSNSASSFENLPSLYQAGPYRPLNLDLFLHCYNCCQS